MSGLTFKTLREANLARLPLFRDARGRISHRPDGSNWSLAQWTNAVTGELGEFANVVKKIDRGDFAPDEARQMLADELADIVTYLDILAYRCGVDLGAVTIDKWNRVSERVGAPIRIDEQGGWYKLQADPGRDGQS